MDSLVGLKENVIIGKLIPAGTGMKRYRNTSINTDFKNPLLDKEEEKTEKEEAVIKIAE